MFYAVTARKADSVSLTAKGSFTGPDDLNLIVSKCTHLEIFVVVDDTSNEPESANSKVLRLVLDVPTYGRVAAMLLYRPEDRETDLLFVLTESYKYFVVSYKPETNQLVNEYTGDVGDRTGRPSDTGIIGLLDPQCRMIGLHMYQGLFKIVPLAPGNKRAGSGKKQKPGDILSPFNVRLEELNVISMAFLHAQHPKPILAVLAQDTKENRYLETYVVDQNVKDLQTWTLKQNQVEPGASMLIPVPLATGGGVIVVGEQTITYISETDIQTVPITPTVMKCYNQLDEEGMRYLLGDYLGNLYVLVLFAEDGKVTELRLQKLGEVSQPSAIEYLDNGHVYIGSHFGDSQFIALSTEQDAQGNYVEVKQEFPNLAPISDFCVVDPEGQGQGQIVACCGANKDSSLRVIRNGIGIEEHGELEDVRELKGLWSLKPTLGAEIHDTLVMSFIDETRIYSMDDGVLSPLEDTGGFRIDESTVCCANVLGDQFVQVTTSSVVLISREGRMTVSEWNPPQGSRIIQAFVNPAEVVLSFGSGWIVHLTVEGNNVKETNRKQLEHEIACVDASPLDSSLSANVRSPFCIVGLWNDMSVRILALPTFEETDKQLLSGETLPRSALLTRIEGVDYAMVGLGDGQLFTFNFDPTLGVLSDRKKISLGSQPIMLRTFQSGGTTNVFAASDRPTVIYTSNGKLVYSNVNLKEVSYMCPFTYSATPALAIVTEDVLKIGSVESIQKLHVKKIPLTDTPRRIAYQEKTRTFGVLVCRVWMNDEGEEEECGWFKCLDAISFDVLDEYQLDPSEGVQSLITVNFADAPQPFYVVGTCYVRPTEDQPSEGRILVLMVNQDRQLELVSETTASGSVYCLGEVDGKIVAGVNGKVQMYTWSRTPASDRIRGSLTPTVSHYGFMVALTISVRGEFILVGDMIKSVTLLRYNPADDSLELVARDNDPTWVTAADMIDDDLYIMCENGYNLKAVRRRSESEVEDERRRMVQVGAWHLGEYVNKFRHGSLVMTLPDIEQPAQPALLYCTVNGAIGAIATLDEEKYNILTKMQQNMRKVARGVGGLTHTDYRRFVTERRSEPDDLFIDGDLIETFLDMSKDQQAQIIEGVDVNGFPLGIEEAGRLVEDLARVH
ncbi:DNA damage-binding protein 1a [Borealophlyctis nickersoniae]|nr:DNA damage-binding protein 1a [Borealophlyctis nickersoniae]